MERQTDTKHIKRCPGKRSGVSVSQRPKYARTVHYRCLFPFSIHLWLVRWLLTWRTVSREPLPGWERIQSNSPQTHSPSSTFLTNCHLVIRLPRFRNGAEGKSNWPPIRLIRPYWIWLMENTKIRHPRQNHPITMPWSGATSSSFLGEVRNVSNRWRSQCSFGDWPVKQSSWLNSYSTFIHRESTHLLPAWTGLYWSRKICTHSGDGSCIQSVKSSSEIQSLSTHVRVFTAELKLQPSVIVRLLLFSGVSHFICN